MSLRENLLHNMAVIWWSLKRPRHPDAFTVPAGGVKANHLVVILPPEFEDFDVARYAVESLADRIRPYRLTVLVRENFKSWLTGLEGARFLTYDPHRKNLLGFPANASRISARKLGADVVIDLTPRFSQYTAGLAAATNAPLRVSLEKEHAAEFFNVVVKPRQGRSLHEKYHVLLTHL